MIIPIFATRYWINILIYIENVPKLSTPFLQGFWTKSLGWCLISILLINPLNLHKTCLTMSKSNMLYKIYYIVNNRGVLIFDGTYFRFLHEFAQNKGLCLFSRIAYFR